MFKEGEEVLNFTNGGGANHKTAYLIAGNNKVHVKKTFLGSAFPYFFYVPLVLFFLMFSYVTLVLGSYYLLIVCFFCLFCFWFFSFFNF